MAGPGGIEGGRVSIRVVPDTTGFRRELKTKLEAAVKGLKIEIDIEPDLDGLRQKIKAATKGLSADVEVKAKTAKAKAELATLERNYRGELTVKTNVETVIGKIMALRALTRENLRAKVIYNDAPLAKASYRVFYLWSQWRRLLTLLRSYAIFMTYLSAALMPPLFSLSIETLTAGAGLIAAAAGMLSAVGSLAVGGLFTFIAWKSEEVQEAWAGVKENIKDSFAEMNQPVADALVRNLPMLETALEVMRPNIEHISQGVSEVIDKIGRQMPEMASAAGDMMERMWDSGRRNLEAFIDAIPGLLSGIGDFFQIIGESDSIHRAWTDFLRNLPNWMGSWGRGLDNVAKFFYRMRDYLQSDQLQKYSQGLKDFADHMRNMDWSRWKEGITDMLNAFGTFLSDTNWQGWFDFFGKIFTMISKLSDHLSAVGPLGALATYAAVRMGAAFTWGLGSELMAMGTRRIGRMVFGSAANIREHGIIAGSRMGRGMRDGMDTQTKRVQVQTESRFKKMSNNLANTFRAGMGAVALGGPNMFGVTGKAGDAGRASVGMTKFTEETKKAGEASKKSTGFISGLGTSVEKAGGKASRAAVTAAKFGGVAALLGFADPVARALGAGDDYSFLGKIEDGLYGAAGGVKSFATGLATLNLEKAGRGFADFAANVLTLGHWSPDFAGNAKSEAQQLEEAAQQTRAAADQYVEAMKLDKDSFEFIDAVDWSHLFPEFDPEDVPDIIGAIRERLELSGPELEDLLMEWSGEFDQIFNGLKTKMGGFAEAFGDVIPVDLAAVSEERLHELAAKIRDGSITVEEAWVEIKEAISGGVQIPEEAIDISGIEHILNQFGVLPGIVGEGTAEAASRASIGVGMINQALGQAGAEAATGVGTNMSMIPPVVSEHLGNAKAAATTGTSGISGIISNAFGGISPKVAFAMLAISNAVKGKTDEMRNSVSSSFPAMEGTITGAMEGARDGGTASMTALAQSIGEKVQEGIGHVRPMPPEIQGIMNQPGLLTSAGASIMNGFVDAMVATWRARKGELNAITNEVPLEKGPPERDAVLLVPAGNLVMDGFHEGILQGWGRVQGTLNDITGKLADSFNQGGLQGLATEGAAIAATAGDDVANSFLDAFDEAFEKRGWTGVSEKLVESFDVESLGKNVGSSWTSQFMSDLGLQGDGVLGRLISNPDDMGKVQTLIFHVNNLDEALEAERRLRREKADEMSELR